MRSSTTLLSLLLLTLWPFSTSASASSHSPASSDHRPRYLTKKGNLVNNPHLKGRYSGRDASPAGMNVARWNRWAKYKRDEAPLPLHSPLSGVNPSLSVQQQIKVGGGRTREMLVLTIAHGRSDVSAILTQDVGPALPIFLAIPSHLSHPIYRRTSIPSSANSPLCPQTYRTS